VGPKSALNIVAIFALVSALSASIWHGIPQAYAHFYGGQTQNVGKYSIVFVPSPDPPYANDSSSKFGFSVLLNNDNIYNIQTAMEIREKESNKTVVQTPYETNEFSDVSFPVTVPKPGNYVATLYALIPGDKDYSVKPLIANFGFTAFDRRFPIPIDELLLLYVAPAAVAIGGIVVYLHSKNKI
jgi:hypothetical protein